MSSHEIAALTEKRHDHVMTDIRKMLSDIGKAAPEFSGTARVNGPNNSIREVEVFNLPRDLTVTLITGYRADLRYKVIKRLEELEAQSHFDPSKFLESPAAMRGLLLTYTERVIELESRVEDMREDVAAHDRLTKADGSLNTTEAAKNLGIRPKELFDWLSHNGWIYKRPNGGAWLGYQSKCNTGLLEHKTTTVLRADGSEKITEQVRITARGLSALARLVHPAARLIN